MENIRKVPKLKPPMPIFERSSHLPKILKKIFIYPQKFSGDFISPRTLLPPGNFHFSTRFQDGFGTQFPPSNHTHTNRSPKWVKSHPTTQHFVVIGGLYSDIPLDPTFIQWSIQTPAPVHSSCKGTRQCPALGPAPVLWS